MTNNKAVGADPLNWLGVEAPRYTSYPSAHHFSSQIGVDQQLKWLEAITPATSVSAYVHVPFCQELCWFCGCHTKMTKRYKAVADYVQLLLQEMRILKEHVNPNAVLTNIHFGGGSPSLLEADDLDAILQAMGEIFSIHSIEELAIELDPRTTTPEKIKLYADMGFNRVSLGLQDFNIEVQQAINRVQSHKMVAKLMDDLRAAGLEKINCDLIYGLPHQTARRFQYTLEATISLQPQRIALFSYAHVPQVKKHQRMIDEAWLPSELDKLALYRHAAEFLTANGYVAIGIDHYAKADDPLTLSMQHHTMRRNFQGYVTDDTDVILGMGTSAISQFPQGYIQNTIHKEEYQKKLVAHQLCAVRGWQLSAVDHIRKRVIDQLMCFMAVDLAAIRAELQLPSHYFEAELILLQQPQYQKIIDVEGEKISLHSPYRMAIRVVAAVFDQYHTIALGRYSKVA